MQAFPEEPWSLGEEMKTKEKKNHKMERIVFLKHLCLILWLWIFYTWNNQPQTSRDEILILSSQWCLVLQSLASIALAVCVFMSIAEVLPCTFQWASYLLLTTASLLPADWSLCSMMCLGFQNDDRGGQLFRTAAQASMIQSTVVSPDLVPWYHIFPVNNKSLYFPNSPLSLMLGQLATCRLACFCKDSGRYNFTEAGNTPVLTWVYTLPAVIFKKYIWLFVHIKGCSLLMWLFGTPLTLAFVIQVT